MNFFHVNFSINLKQPCIKVYKKIYIALLYEQNFSYAKKGDNCKEKPYQHISFL